MPQIRLSPKDRQHLQAHLSGGIQPVRSVLQALALLQMDQGVSAAQIARVVPLTAQAIRKIGHRFEEGGWERALYDKPRPGAAALLDDGQQQRIIAMVCSEPPAGRSRWTVRLVAEEAVKRRLVPRVGRKAIRVMLLNHDLKPWREKMWCVPVLDDRYIANMEDVLALYERAHNPQQPVVCLDEKPITLHGDVRPATAAKPGREARMDSEYERRGTANAFLAVEPKAGRHFCFPTPNRSGVQFAKVLSELAMSYPKANKIHLVMDNLNIHTRKSLTDAFGSQMGSEVWGRFAVHYTPKHGSWLNQAEIAISIFAKQCPGKRRIADFRTLRRECKAWVRRRNKAGTKINWKFDGKTAQKTFSYKRNTFTRSQN